MNALKKQEEENESDSGSDSSDGSSSSKSSSSSFAKGCPGADGKPAAKKRAKAKAKAPAAKKTKVDDDKKNKKMENQKEKENARFRALMLTHKKTQDLLGEVAPYMVWRSLVRSAEVDRRLTKANSSIEEMQKVQANSKMSEEQVQEAKHLEENLTKSVSWVGAMRDLSRMLRTMDGEALSKELYSSSTSSGLAGLVGKCTCQLFEELDTVGDMVHTMAKKLFEAHLPVC